MRTSTPGTHCTLAVVCSLPVAPEELFPQVLMNCPGLGLLWSHTSHQGVAQLSRVLGHQQGPASTAPHGPRQPSPVSKSSRPACSAPRGLSPDSRGRRTVRIRAPDLFLGNASEREQGALGHTTGRLRPSFRGPSRSAVVGRLLFHALYNRHATGGQGYEWTSPSTSIHRPPAPETGRSTPLIHS